MAETPQENAPNLVDQFANQSDFLNQATISQPAAINFDFNEPKPVINPIYPIKDNITGVSPNYYPSQAKSNSLQDPVAAGNAAFDQTLNYMNNAVDLNKYAYAYGFDSSPKNTFRDRYKAYGQETFNKIGFSPLIDNESFFNARTTFSDDLSRWWNHAAWPMLTKGFMDPIRSYQSIINGDGLFNADEQSARDYEYYNALGQSSKGGLGGFTVNLLNSASYSMGILLEGAIESALIEGVVGAGSGAGIAGSAGYGLGKLVNRLGSLPKSLYETGKGTLKLAETMKDYTQIHKAKDLFKSAGANFGNFLNPLSNTTKALSVNVNNIADLARASKTPGAFWHDMMVMNLALSEGKLEGGFTKYQTYDKLYNEYVNKNNGKAPSLEEQENMMKEASKASFWNTLNNTALIFYSNKLVFPSLTNASFLKGTPKFGFGTVIGDINKEFQLVFKPGKNIAKSTFSKEKIGLANAIKSLGNPSSYGKLGLNYFKANVVEGVQESLQDVLQEATQNYYVSTYNDQSSRNFLYGAGLVSDAINKQFSAQGAETFLSGFLMGSILQAPSKMKSFMTMGYNDYLRKDSSYRTYMEERETEANELVDHMNTMWENSDLLFDPRMTNYKTQALLYSTVDDPAGKTTKEIQDERFAAFETAVLSSLQRGTFDMFLKHYEKYKQATPQDIEEAWSLKPGEGAKALQKFDESLENAKKISFRWNNAKEKMKNFMLDLNDYEKDSYKYKMAKIYNSAFMQSIFNYVFLQDSFDNTAEREAKLYNKLSELSPIKNSNFANFAILSDPKRLQNEIEILKTDISNLEQSDVPLTGADLERKRTLLKVFSNFKEKQDAIISTYIAKEKLSFIAEEILQQNPDLSRDQLNLQVFDKLIKQYDEGKSNEFIEYKEAFKDLLFGLTKTEEEKLKLQQEIDSMDKGFDGLFDTLLDTHILKNEKAQLIPYINLLSNPAEFYNHLQRNFQWMKNIYHNKKNIIKDIVNQEITAIERNTLLNELADQGIFVDLEEFGKWVEDPTYQPEYFIDETNKSVIPRGGLLYNEYYKLFERAAELAAEKPAGEPETDSQVLEGIIEDLSKDRDAKIDNAKKKFDKALKDKYNATEIELRKLASEAQAKINENAELEVAKLEEFKKDLEEIEDLASIRKVAARLVQKEIMTNEQLIEATDIFLSDPKNENKIIKLRDRILQDDDTVTDPAEAVENAGFYFVIKPFLTDLVAEQQGIVDNLQVPDFIDVEKTEEWDQYQKELTTINNEYEELLKEARLDFMEAGGNPLATPEYSIDNSFEEFPEELQNQLTISFDDFLVNRLGEALSLKTDSPVKYSDLRSRWQEAQPEAAEIIEKYNQKVKQEAIKNSKSGLTPPQLTYGNIVIQPGTPLSNLTDLYESYEKAIVDKELTTEDNKKIKLSAEDIKNIKADMKAIAAYIENSEKAYIIKPIAQEKIELLERTIFNRQDELVVTVDEDGVERRTFRDAKPEDPRPERATEVATQIESALTGKKPFIYNKLEDGSIQNLFTEIVLNNTVGSIEERIDAFLANLKNSYPQFRSDKKIAGIKQNLLEDPTIEGVERTIPKYVYKESSDAGIHIDALTRIFISRNPLTGRFMEIPYDSTITIRDNEVKISDLMSKKAYDFLFHPVKGAITKFRRNMIDGEFQVFSENVKVFDRNARDGRGVTGELDLLLINPEGQIAVVDIKAAQKGTWKNLGIPTYVNKSTGEEELNKANKKEYFRAQQTIYGYSIHNMSGLDADLLLFPLEMTIDMDGYINDITAPTADLSKNNQMSENGMFIILEPLDDATMLEFGFEKVKPEDIVTLPFETEEEEAVPEGAISITNPEKTTLNDLLDEDVIYNGSPGKLIINGDGGFSVEIEDETGKIAIYDLYLGGMPIKDGTVNMLKAGLLPVAEIEVPGQVTEINNAVINARFLDKSEKTAEINGVKYTVNRDAQGSIVSLTFNTNDKAIADVQKKIDTLNKELSDLKKKEKTKNTNREITKKTFELNGLMSQKTDLINKNKKRTMRGGNANDYIFALNRLPGNFKNQTPVDQPGTREKQIEDYKKLSESTVVANEVMRILVEHGMPTEVEQIMDGNVQNITQSKINTLKDWAVELVIKFEEYQSRLNNEQRSTVQVDNMIQTIWEFYNSIEAIKFRKDGKITAKSRKELQRTARNKQSTAVPTVQESAGTTAEGVSGQAISGEELTNIIQESRRKITGISVTPTEVSGADENVYSEIESMFENATLDNIEEILADALTMYVLGNEKGLYTDAVNNAYMNKRDSLMNDMSFESIAEGNILVNTQPIGTSKKLNDNYVVQSKNEKEKTVTLYNPKRKKNFTFTEVEIKNNFMKPVDEAKPVEEIIVTPQVKENVKSTTDNVQDLVKDTDLLNDIEKTSKSQTKDDRLNNLRNKFNQC